MSNKNVKLLLALLAAEVLSAFEVAMIYAALRHMIEYFGSPEAVGWTITSFLLASAVSAALCSRLGDMYDRRRILLTVIVLSIIGSLLSGFSTTIAGIIVGRVIQGSAGAIFPLCVGIVREHVEPPLMPTCIGLLAATMVVSAGLGVLLGGVLVDNLSWRWIFFAGAAVGLIALVFAYLYVPSNQSGNVQRGTNFIGGVLFAPGLVFLLLAITKSPAWGWENPLTLSFLGAGLIILALWIWSELRAKVPLLNVRLLANREILIAYLVAAIFGLTWNQQLQIWSILLQQPVATGTGLGLSATVAGLVMLPQTMMALVGGPAAGWCFSRFGPRFAMSSSALVLGTIWIAAVLKHDSVPFILLLMVLMGGSSAFVYSLMPMIIAHSAPPDRTSEATGMMIVLRISMMGIGAQVVASMLSSSTITGPLGSGSFPDESAYTLAMSYVVVGCLLIFLVSLWLPRRCEPPEPEPASSSDKQAN